MSHDWFMVLVGLALSVFVAVSVALCGHGRAVGWLWGLGVQVCWVLVAALTHAWTLLLGPAIVGPQFWRNWRRWHARDVARERVGRDDDESDDDDDESDDDDDESDDLGAEGTRDDVRSR